MIIEENLHERYTCVGLLGEKIKTLYVVSAYE